MYSFRHVIHCLVIFVLCYITVFSTFFVKEKIPGKLELIPRSFTTNLTYYSILILCYFGVIEKIFCVIINLTGLIFYECFPGEVELKADLLRLPRISFRIVTRGDYPDLVSRNASLIESICYRVGLKDFLVEIVTEKRIQVPESDHVTQILVPKDYKTKHGTLFKARNLQYCLEDDVSSLSDEDWIIHMDEDSILTTDALKGIANFVQEGKYQYGIGRISYDPDNITGIFTQLLMSPRVACDFAYYKVFCNFFNGIPCFVKGSFIACNVGAEKDISFDGGSVASLIEFIYFSFNGNKKGYRAGVIEGEVIELGTLTVGAIVKQLVRGASGFRHFGKNNFFTGKLWFFYQMNLIFLHNCFFYLVSFAITLVVDFGFHSRVLTLLIGISAANNIYMGIFWLYKKYATLSWSKIISFFVLNLIIGAFYFDFVFTLCYCWSWFKTTIYFDVTKKTL